MTLKEAKEEIWIAWDTTDLRKPYAREMEALMEVRDLNGKKVPGYKIVTGLGMVRGKRGLLYHHLFSSKEEGFKSEPYEVRKGLRIVMGSLEGAGVEIIHITDRGFDDKSIWSEIWEKGQHIVSRIYLMERKVYRITNKGNKLETDLRGCIPYLKQRDRKKGQKKAKKQEVYVR